MWGNITGAVGAAFEKVQKIQNDIETQLDKAVGAEPQPQQDVASTPEAEPKTELKTEPKTELKAKAEQTETSTETATAPVLPQNELDTRCPVELSANNCESPSPTEGGEGPGSHAGTDERSRTDAVRPTPSKARRETESESVKEIKAKAREKFRAQEARHAAEMEAQRGELLSWQTRHRGETQALLDELAVLKAQCAQHLQMKERWEAEKQRFESEARERREAVESGTASESEESAQLLKSAVAELESQLKYANTEHAQKNAQWLEKVQSLEQSCKQAEERAQSLSQSNTDLERKHRQLQEDLERVREVLQERERQCEAGQQAMVELRSELADKDNRLLQSLGSVKDGGELRLELERCRELLREKDERLIAFEEEGRNLAKKQSEMEKSVRKTKLDMRNKDKEISDLKESKEDLLRSLEKTQETLKKHELEAINASKTLSAMQAVSQASADKLSRLEGELMARQEEIASQRRALEASWADANELKRIVADLRAERDDLKRQLGEGTTRVLETETTRKEIEQREAVLRATSRQLQENLQAQMKESSQREERIREELQEMRRRWQEAVAMRETQTSELGQATAPLLRQIASLQESLRIRSEQWQTIENTLTERALRAEKSAELFEHKKSLLEDQLQHVQQQLGFTSSRLHDQQEQLRTVETALDRYKRLETAWSEERLELVAKVSAETAQKNALQNTLRESELRHKVELQEIAESNKVQIAEHEMEISRLKRDTEKLEQELLVERASKGERARPANRHAAAESVLTSQEPMFARLGSTLPNGDVSFVGNEKLQFRNQQRDDELLTLQTQLHQLQTSRNALLDEVSFLSSRNAQLEEDVAELSTLREEATRSRKQLELVLVLLGEKEEELEALVTDMKEIKHMYAAHIAELLEQIKTSECTT